MSVTRHRTPVTWDSRVRGMLLGVALGDALGSLSGDVPRTGVLRAGCATQLTSWTTEGLLRSATRYGGNVLPNPTDVVKYAYQRWALLRGGAPGPRADWWPDHDDGHLPSRGWLLDVRAMAQRRGSSPSTLAAITSGTPAASTGYHAMVRSFPIAAFAHTRHPQPPLPGHAEHYARGIAALTHDTESARESAALAVRLAAACLVGDRVDEVLRWMLRSTEVEGEPWTRRLSDAVDLAVREPCRADHLARLAPDRTGIGALAGAVYAVLSFPEPDTAGEALTLARWAPHPKPLAAATGALLGATYGYEALPAGLVERLELGWVADRLARDLALQVRENQVGSGWKGDFYEPPLDPWWDTRYPGV